MDVTQLIPRTIFGMSISYLDDPIRMKIPRVFLEEFDILRCQLSGRDDLSFHALVTPTRPSTKSVKAAVKAIAEIDDLPCVVCCPAMDFDQKESLAREGIAYIQNTSNALLPFIGGIISEGWTAQQPRRLSFQAQRIFVNYFAGYWVHRNARQLAELMGVSNASVSKYLAELMAIYPALVTQEGKNKYLRPPVISRAKLLDLFEPYLVNPVKIEHRLRQAIPLDSLREYDARLSGESELALFSDLAQPSVMTVALTSEKVKGLKRELELAWEEAPGHSEAAMIVQEWVCPIDHSLPQIEDWNRPAGLPLEWLYVSLVTDRSENDVRFIDALEQLREKICRQ